MSATYGLMAMILGIESTAHTLSFGLVSQDCKALPSSSDLYAPEEGGIHPREAADHHSEIAGHLFLSEIMFFDVQKLPEHSHIDPEHLWKKR